MKRGLVHCYTGDGKGKTTAAMGLGLRAAGCGLRVTAVQFLKAAPTGEVSAIERLEGQFTIHRFCTVPTFYPYMTPSEQRLTKEQIRQSFTFAKEAAAECNVLILDEIFAAVSLELITQDDLIAFIQSKPSTLELVLTGRDAPRRVMDCCDYVSKIDCIKHPYQQGIDARRGIEF